MLKKLLFFCLVLMLFPTVLAETDTKKAGTAFDRVVFCSNDESPCSGTATCNITIVSPTSEIVVNNQPMTKNNNVFNYTLPSNLTRGLYEEAAYCCDGALCSTQNGYFMITTNGKEENDLFGILGLCFIVGLLFFFAFKITDATHVYLQLLLVFFGICFALLIPAYFFITSYQALFFNLFMAFTVVFFIYVLVYYIWYNYQKYLSRTP